MLLLKDHGGVTLLNCLKLVSHEYAFAAGRKPVEVLWVLQEEHGGAGVYSADLRKGYTLKSDEWKYDILPEIIEGHNVLDFVDADIEARLEALEREEDALAAAAALEVCQHRVMIRVLPCSLQHARCSHTARLWAL